MRPRCASSAMRPKPAQRLARNAARPRRGPTPADGSPPTQVTQKAARGLRGQPLTAFLCEASRRGVLEDLDALMRGEMREARHVVGLLPEGDDPTEDAARPRPDIDLTLRRLRSGDGFGLVACLTDATARRRDARARAMAELELAEMRRERRAVLARVSHEMRTPLNAIVGFSEVMLEERFGALGSVRYQDYARDIRDGGRHLIGLIGDLMDLIRLQDSDAPLPRGPVALNALVARAVSRIEARADERRIILRCSLASDLPSVEADADSVVQIAANLLDASLAEVGPGDQVIVSTSRVPGGGAVLRIRDGVARDPQALRALMAPFASEIDIVPTGDGASLSLPLARALALANGADLSIETAEGHGTLAQVSFPGHMPSLTPSHTPSHVPSRASDAA